METPTGSCGAYVERVMVNINARLDRTKSPRLHDGQYNRVYEAVHEECLAASKAQRLAVLREVREHFMAWHRLELGLLIGGSLEASSVTKIFALFLNQIDAMIAKEEKR